MRQYKLLGTIFQLLIIGAIFSIGAYSLLYNHIDSPTWRTISLFISGPLILCLIFGAAFLADKTKMSDVLDYFSVFILFVVIHFIICLFNFSTIYNHIEDDISQTFFPRNYTIELNKDTHFAIIEMPCPTIGMVGIGEVGFAGFTYNELEEELFDKIRNNSYEGDWKVYVLLRYKDSYGNYYSDDYAYHVSTLNGNDLRKYATYSYFSGKAMIQRAFPWNRNKEDSVDTMKMGTMK